MPSGLDGIIRRMNVLYKEIDEREEEYAGLREEAFPAVAKLGDEYTVDGIEVRIVRGTTWAVDAVALLAKFGRKIHPLLEVSVTKFREALESGMFNPPRKQLAKIAHQVPTTPQFRLTPK